MTARRKTEDIDAEAEAKENAKRAIRETFERCGAADESARNRYASDVGSMLWNGWGKEAADLVARDTNLPEEMRNILQCVTSGFNQAVASQRELAAGYDAAKRDGFLLVMKCLEKEPMNAGQVARAGVLRRPAFIMEKFLEMAQEGYVEAIASHGILPTQETQFRITAGGRRVLAAGRARDRLLKKLQPWR